MKYKNIRSAAHNFADSFASSLNYDSEDYIMSHLARQALSTGVRELTIDLLSGQGSPSTLFTEPIARNVATRVAAFPSQLRRQNIEPERVRKATMRILFEDSRVSDDIGFPGYKEMPFEIWTRLVDDRGKEHLSHFRRWWGFHPTKPEIASPSLWKRIIMRFSNRA